MLSNLTSKWWFKWLVIGVVIRLILMPITLHPDLWGHSFVAYFFAYEGVLNPYEHLLTLATDHPLVTNFGVGDIFIYPPLTYFTFGIFRLLVSPFVDASFIPWLWNNVGEAHTRGDIASILILFKLPYLFIDIAAAFLLSSLFNNKTKKRLSFIAWVFNPVTLYATFMMGQLDILPVFFTLLSAYYYKNFKYNHSAVALGVGAAYKMYPILLLIPLAMLAKSKFADRVKLLIVGIIPFVVSIAPFLGSAAYRQMALFSPKSSKMLFMNWKLTAAEGIFPFILVLILIYWGLYYTKRKLNLETIFLSILLLIFSVSHYHPQWFLWVTPFLIWSVVKDRSNIILVITLFTVWLYTTFMFEPSLNVGLFHVVFPDLREFIGLDKTLSSRLDGPQINSIVRSVFAATSLVLTYRLYAKNQQTS